MYAMEINDDEESISVLGLCSGWGGICGSLSRMASLFGIGGHLSIIGSLDFQRHGIIHMYVVSRSTLCIEINVSSWAKVVKHWH